MNGCMLARLPNPFWFRQLAFAQIGQALATRSSNASLFQIGLRSNPLLLGMMLAVFVLQILVVYLPPMQGFFETRPLTLVDMLIALGAGVVVFGAIELEETLTQRRPVVQKAV